MDVSSWAVRDCFEASGGDTVPLSMDLVELRPHVSLCSIVDVLTDTNGPASVSVINVAGSTYAAEVAKYAAPRPIVANDL